MKRRILSAFLAILMVFSLLPVASATGTQTAILTVEQVYANPDKDVTVEIKIEDNPGILGATLTLSWEDGLELVEAENGAAFSALTMTPPSRYISGCNFVWFGSETGDIIDDTVLILTFHVKETATAEENYGIYVTYESGDVLDGDYNAVEFLIENGGVRVITYLPGDVTGEWKINALDLVRLSQYISDGCKTDPNGYNVSINESAADVNDDGKINALDLVFISRYISDGCKTDPTGYNITLKPSTPKCSHTMQEVPYQAATCTKDGNIGYWYCTTCEKCFTAADGKTELSKSKTVMPAKGHTPVAIPAVEPTYTSTGSTEGSKCSTCGEILASPTEIPMLEKDEYFITYVISVSDSYLQSIIVENPNPNTYTTQDGLSRLDELVVAGYNFEGWYDGQGESANKVTKISVGTTGNMTLYAHWSKVEYTITFNSPLAETSSKSYTVDTGATLTNPSYYGYTFVGWSDKYGNIVTTVPVGTTGNMTLTANWTSKRNQTIPVSSLDDPLITEDEENGILFFTYYIGRMENVPLYTIKDFAYNSGGGITWSETVSYEYSISEENATSVANSIAEATTNTSSWTLAKGWNSLTSISETQSVSTTAEKKEAYEHSFAETGSYSVGNSVGGASSATTESGISSKVSATVSEKTSVSTELQVSAPGAKASAEAGVEIGYSITGEVGGSYTATEENSKNWSSSNSFESSTSASSSSSVSSSLSSTISKEYSIGQSYGSSEEFEESNALAVSKSSETEYGSSFAYATGTKTSVTKTYSNEGSTDGYYRLVCAGTVHVFAVVGYDIASASYFLYTYNVMDENTYEFMDYSATTGGYDDLQNGILPFEVPYEVNTYVDSLTLATKGLTVDVETGIITDYTGTADHVMIPRYMSIDDGNGGKIVVRITGIESDAFAGNTSIVEVKFPDTITEIPDTAFKGCTALTGVIANNIASIGKEAFSGCTALESYTVGASVTVLGENAFTAAPAIIVNANNTSVAKAAASSGANSITLNVNSMTDTLSNYVFVISAGTNYFAFNGAGESYSNVRIISDATTTVINNVTFIDCKDTTLVLSSKNVTLNRVTVETSTLALVLTAETANVALYGSVNMNSVGSDAVHSNNVVFSLANNAVSSKMYVRGNMLVCGTVTNEKYLSVSNGSLICYSAADSCVVTFDANGGSCDETTRVISCGTAIGELPEAKNSGYVFYGWVDGDGNIVTADTICYASGEMTLYAQWIEPYIISWSAGTGYTITVTRTASPKGGAAIGTLSSGDSIYPDDVLSITYTAQTGYSIDSTGSTSVTVTGNVDSNTIYATASANSYTYTIVYKSSNGTDLGSSSATYKFGTTNTITPPSKSGYTTPSAQSVAWDSTSKTIEFIYTPAAVSATTTSGTCVSNPVTTYTARMEYRNRTATSVQVRVVWTSTIQAYGYNAYAQMLRATCGSSSATATVAAWGTWSNQVSYARSSTGTTDWITVPLSTTNQTSVSVGIYYYQTNYNGDDMGGISATWSMAIPAY